MELTPRLVRQLRLTYAQPVYPIDDGLVRRASNADEAGGDIYAAIRNPATQIIYRYLTEFVVQTLKKHSAKPLDQLKVLDWGGGKGYATYFLNNRGLATTLYETDSFPHRSLWREHAITAVTGRGDKLPFQDKTFDAVVGFGVLEHVPYDYDALKEVNRVLKNDGLLFCFNLPNKTGYVHHVAWHRGVRYHDRLYSVGEIRQLLKRTGFSVAGRPWYRQLLPKTHYHYPKPHIFERLDLLMTNYTPLCLLAASIEFVARKQHTYTSGH